MVVVVMMMILEPLTLPLLLPPWLLTHGLAQVRDMYSTMISEMANVTEDTLSEYGGFGL